MPPQQQIPAPDYNFIVNGPPKAPRPSLFGGTSRTRQLMLFAGGGVVVLILLLIIALLFSGGGSSAKLTYAKILREQSTLSQLATSASSVAGSQETKNIAANTSLAAGSAKQQLLSTLVSRGVKFKSKELIAGPTKDVTDKLTAAQAAAAYDSTLLAIMDKQLATYQADLQQADKLSKSQAVKQTLAANYQGATLLRAQIAAAQPQ